MSTRFRSSADVLAVLRICWVWRMSGPSRSIWFQARLVIRTVAAAMARRSPAGCLQALEGNGQGGSALPTLHRSVLGVLGHGEDRPQGDQFGRAQRMAPGGRIDSLGDNPGYFPTTPEGYKFGATATGFA